MNTAVSRLRYFNPTSITGVGHNGCSPGGRTHQTSAWDVRERLPRKRLAHSRIRRIAFTGGRTFLQYFWDALFCNTSALSGFLERRGKAREEERFEAYSSDGDGILAGVETPRCGRVEGFSEQEMSSGLAKDCIRAVQLLYFSCLVFGLDKRQARYLVWR